LSINCEIIPTKNGILEMEQSYYQYFLKRTEEFIFSDEENEPLNRTNSGQRKEMLKALIKQASKMAVKSFYQMPKSFSVVYPKEDWIQFVMIKFLECCDTYDHQRPFDHYVRFALSRRLIDRQRKIFRENPPIQKDLHQQYKSLKRQKGVPPSVKELMDYTSRDENEIRRFLENGFGKRMFIHRTDAVKRKAESKSGVSPEKQYIDKEARLILWNCINQLKPESKLIFIRHEMEGMSFKKIYEKLTRSKKSLATFKRRYKTDVYNLVKDCVELQYP